MIKKKDLKFYRVDNFKGNPASLVPSTFTLQQLITKVKQNAIYKQFEIFLESQLLEQQQANMSLTEIVKQKHFKKEAATFYIVQCSEQTLQESEEGEQYYQSIIELLRLQEATKTEWRGANGHLLFDGRDNSLIASSYHHSCRVHKSNSTYSINAEHVLSQEVGEQEGKKQKVEEVKEIKKLISFLKEKRSKQELAEYKQQYLIDKKYSNFDINFVTTLEKTYLTYMLRSGCKLTYVDYHQWSFGVIQRQITKNDKVGIIGDFGTGLEDSYQLLENMIVGCGVNIVLHLGDVYYAGTPEEYENNIGCFLKKLRGITKKEILFYSIPGNHDYYSWGMPFLCFVKEINNQEFSKQKASYFCLRSEDNKWQFLGADTAYHDSNPFDQINQINAGPRLRKAELAWHRQKMENFEGSTIFLSHHQLFSIHDRLCGSLSSYRHFSCINPLISKQLFEYMPYFSAWYWGHEHAFMMFREDFWGVRRCRLLGNSSFHVIFDKEHPYHRKPSFPIIPFITEDQTYLKKYLPLNPKGSLELYFNLCFGVIDFEKGKENLLVEYYCSPSYDESSKKKCQFKHYKLYEEIIENKDSIISRSTEINCDDGYFLKNQIGLVLDYIDHLFHLNFKGLLIKIHPIKQEKLVEDEMRIHLFIPSFNSYLSSSKQSVILQQNPTQHSIWTFKKVYVMHDSSRRIRKINCFTIRNECEMKYLSFSVGQGSPTVNLSNNPTYWQCLGLQEVITV